MIIKEHISFTRGEDPKKIIGIGIYSEKNFSTLDECIDFLFEVLPEILKTEKIPEDIILTNGTQLFPWGYYESINAYVQKYIKEYSMYSICRGLHEKLLNNGYKRYYRDMNIDIKIKESMSFERGKDPKEVLGIGKYRKLLNLKPGDIFKYKDNVKSGYGLNVRCLIVECKQENFNLYLDFAAFAGSTSAKHAFKNIFKNKCGYITHGEIKSLEEWYNLIDIVDIANESLSFTRGEDPKKILGIGGIYHKRKFETPEEAAQYLYEILPEILHEEKIPKDIIMTNDSSWINHGYFMSILDYIETYIIINNIPKYIIRNLHEILLSKGYKKRSI